MRCPKCNKRSGIYVRIKSGEKVCRNCGYIDKKEQFEEKKGIFTDLIEKSILDTPTLDILKDLPPRPMKQDDRKEVEKDKNE